MSKDCRCKIIPCPNNALFEELELLDKNQWLRLREIRNDIAHEYSFNQEEVVDTINLIYQKSDELIEIYHSILKFINKRFPELLN